jgi:PAS domain-containing protein
MSRNGFRLSSAILALAVFLIDVLTPLEGAVAVAYVVVVLLAAKTGRRNDIVAAAAGSAALTIASYVLTHDPAFLASPALRAIVSLAAITITTALALQNQAATARLTAQARLLNLSHDMIFVRDRRGVITFWNKTAEETYGWPAEEALGRVADELLHTTYSDRRDAIENTLIDSGRWKAGWRSARGVVLPSLSMRDGLCNTIISASRGMCSKPTLTLQIAKQRTPRWFKANGVIAECSMQAGSASWRRTGPIFVPRCK